MEEKGKNPSVYVSYSEDGGLVAKDKEGNVVWTQKLTALQLGKVKKAKEKAERREVRYVYARDINGQKILVPAGFNLDRLPKDAKGREGLALNSIKHEYCETSAANICLLVAEGYSMKEICDMDGFPPKQTMINWFWKHPEFKEAFEEAKKHRAEYYHDRIHGIAHTVTEKNAKSAKVAMDGFKHLASVGDPERYGARTKVVGDSDQPVTIVVDTGIRRDIPIEAEVVVKEVVQIALEANEEPTKD